MIPQETLRHEYLDSRIDPAHLGFCCIFLGGSAAHRFSVEQVAESGSDWDGLGIVNSREDLHNLITRHRNQLLQLLKVDSIDGSPETWNVRIFECNTHYLVRETNYSATEACCEKPGLGCNIDIRLDTRWLKPRDEDLLPKSPRDDYAGQVHESDWSTCPQISSEHSVEPSHPRVWSTY